MGKMMVVLAAVLMASAAAAQQQVDPSTAMNGLILQSQSESAQQHENTMMRLQMQSRRLRDELQQNAVAGEGLRCHIIGFVGTAPVTTCD